MKARKASDVVAYRRRHLDAERFELRHHLAERRVLAADKGDVFAPQVLKPDEVAHILGVFGHDRKSFLRKLPCP